MTTTPTPLTEEQLQAMPLGACVITPGGDTYVHVWPDPHRWVGGSGAAFTAEHLAALDVMPLHLSAEELDALPEGTTVTAEDGVKWTAEDDGEHHWSAPAGHFYSSALAWRRCDRRTIVLPEPEPEPVGLTAEQIQALPAETILIDCDGDKWATLPTRQVACLVRPLWRSVTDLVETYGPIQTATLTVDEIRDAYLVKERLIDTLGRVWWATTVGDDRWRQMVGVFNVDSPTLAVIGVPRTPTTEGGDQ